MSLWPKQTILPLYVDAPTGVGARVGVTTTFVSVVLGQVAAAALIDRFGWLGQRPIHFGWERIVALGLLVVALVLLLRGD